MLNPTDNRTLGCFVKEDRLDNDFKLALYPRWHETSFVLTKEICKTKELYFKMVTDPRIAERTSQAPLDLVKLHHDLAEVTDKWIGEFQRISSEYGRQVEEKFKQFADSIDSRGRIAAKVDRCFKPYVQEAENKRRSVFESFQRNLIDGLLWEHTTRENRRVEEGQPSVGNSTNHETSADNQGSVPQLQWDDYADMNFASSRSAVDERSPEKPVTETVEDDQVRCLN
jgi:hypothetical protein